MLMLQFPMFWISAAAATSAKLKCRDKNLTICNTVLCRRKEGKKRILGIVEIFIFNIGISPAREPQ